MGLFYILVLRPKPNRALVNNSFIWLLMLCWCHWHSWSLHILVLMLIFTHSNRSWRMCVCSPFYFWGSNQTGIYQTLFIFLLMSLTFLFLTHFDINVDIHYSKQNMEKDFKFCTMKLGKSMMLTTITLLMSTTSKKEAKEWPPSSCICKLWHLSKLIYPSL